MEALSMTGIHHLKFPVRDLEASAAWFAKVLGAVRIERFDHREKDGTLYAVMMSMPGLPFPLELREAPKAADAVVGYDPVTFGVRDRSALERWVERFDQCNVPHSPIIRGYIGHLVSFETPDGLVIRFYTDPVGGFEAAMPEPEKADIGAPSLSTPLMQRS